MSWPYIWDFFWGKWIRKSRESGSWNRENNRIKSEFTSKMAHLAKYWLTAGSSARTEGRGLGVICLGFPRYGSWIPRTSISIFLKTRWKLHWLWPFLRSHVVSLLPNSRQKNQDFVLNGRSCKESLKEDHDRWKTLWWILENTVWVIFLLCL